MLHCHSCYCLLPACGGDAWGRAVFSRARPAKQRRPPAGASPAGCAARACCAVARVTGRQQLGLHSSVSGAADRSGSADCSAGGGAGARRCVRGDLAAAEPRRRGARRLAKGPGLGAPSCSYMIALGGAGQAWSLPAPIIKPCRSPKPLALAPRPCPPSAAVALKDVQSCVCVHREGCRLFFVPGGAARRGLCGLRPGRRRVRPATAH